MEYNMEMKFETQAGGEAYAITSASQACATDGKAVAKSKKARMAIWHSVLNTAISLWALGHICALNSNARVASMRVAVSRSTTF
jgi:hypothetical protein